MSRLMPDPVETFSIGFREPEFDETAFAEAASRHTGSQHHTEIVEPDALGILPIW